MSAHESFHRDTNISGSSDRVFGLVMAAFFGIVGLFPLLRGGQVRMWALIVALLFLVPALLFARALRPLNGMWTRFGLLLHRITNPVILGILFYGVFTPMGALMRVLGKDPMKRRMQRDAASYWIPRQPHGPDGRTMSNQF